MFPLFALALKALIFFVMALAAAHAWSEHHQKLLGVRRLGGPEGFMMGDANVRLSVGTRFEHGVDFGVLVHKSPFMADKRDPLFLSNYIFELLEVNPGVAGFLIQLHPEDVDAVLESVTAHAEKGAGTKTTLYVGQEEEEEVEEEVEEVEEVGAGKGKPHNTLMISAQKVTIRPGKGEGKSDGWFPQPLTHNTRRVCTDDPENKLPMHSLCPTREKWEREWYGVTTPNIISGQGVILFPFGATPPLIGEGGEVVAAEPLGAFNRDPNDLVLTVGGRLVVNHLLEHDFLSDVQLQSLLDDLDRVPLLEKAPLSMRTPPFSAVPKILGPAAHCMATMGVPTTTSTTPTSSMICQSSKGWQIVCLRRRRRLWWGVSDGAAPSLTWPKFRAVTTPPNTSSATPPLIPFLKAH